MLAHYRLKKVETEVIVLVYHEHANDKSELIKDFDSKYLPSIFADCTIKAKIFKKFCSGNQIYICIL